MADIAFLLIIFFMVTTTFAMTRGLDFELPKKEKIPEEVEREEAVYIRVLPDGTYEVDGRPMRLSEILSYLAPKLINWPDKPVMIHTEPEAIYESMLAVYDKLRQANEENVGFKVRAISIPTHSEWEEIQRIMAQR